MSTYKSQNINLRPPQLVDSSFWGDIRFDGSDYIGCHDTNGASTADSNWKVIKFSYTGTTLERIQVAYGAWDDRITLF